MPFRIDAFKREYSNNEKIGVISWFDKNFDGGSIYLATYKYDVPSIQFIRQNKVTGYYQQFDRKLSRTACGAGIYHNNKLTFVWIFSTADIPPEMVSSSLHDSVEWTKIDANNAELWSHFYPDDDAELYIYK